MVHPIGSYYTDVWRCMVNKTFKFTLAVMIIIKAHLLLWKTSFTKWQM